MRFNHHVLLNYPRPALAQGYIDFFDDIDQWVQSSSADPVWLANIERLLLDRHIGVDIYGGFATSADLASNFIGLNTGGQQLGVVDILRARIVTEGQQSGWTTAEALQYDTDLAQTLSVNELAGRIDPLVTQMGKVSQAGTLAVLPALGMNNGAALKADTTELLERVDAFSSPNSAPALALGASNGASEIQACGRLPFSILAAYHLRENAAPWFLANPLAESVDELLVLLRANYRLYFAGVEGRQTSLLVRLLDGSFTPASLVDLADELSRPGDLNHRDWRDRHRHSPRPGCHGLLARSGAKATCRSSLPRSGEMPISFDAAGGLVAPCPATFAPQGLGERNADLQSGPSHSAVDRRHAGSERGRHPNFGPIPNPPEPAVRQPKL